MAPGWESAALRPAGLAARAAAVTPGPLQGAQQRKGAVVALCHPLTMRNRGLQTHFSSYSSVL